MNLKVITSQECFKALCNEWNLLLLHNATNEVFLTWQWQHTWWEAYHPGDLWIVTARDDSGALIGLAPWFIEQPTRIVRTIGCVEVTDYLDVIAQPDQRDTFFAALADFLIDNRQAYDHIDLCNIPVGSPFLEAMPRLLTERNYNVKVERQEVCPVIPLPESFEDYLGALDKKQRHELRRKIRRAQENPDDTVDWYIVSPEHDLAAEIEKFIMLMAASHPDKAKFMQDPQNDDFFRAIVPQMAACGWLQLVFLTVNGAPAAAYLNFDFDNRIVVYNSGLMPEKYSHLSPGIVLLTHIIEHAIQQKKSVFDFLRGTEEYKYRMGGQDRPVMMFEAVPA